jgi:protein phosphatase
VTEQLRLAITRVVAVPDPSLVLLVGASGAGKSTFAARHFDADEVVSSDRFRAVVSGAEADQSASRAPFELLHAAVAARLPARRLTVADATNATPGARAPLLELARRHDVPAVAIVLAVRERVCLERNADRANRALSPYVVRAQVRAVRRSLRTLDDEGLARVHILGSPDDVDTVVVERTPRA